jgi:hypothetical protein
MPSNPRHDRPHRNLLQSSPPSPSKGRWLQISLNCVYFSERDLRKTVTLLPQARRDLKLITCLQLHQCHSPLWHLMPEDCNLEFQTVASELGYGILSQGLLHSLLYKCEGAFSFMDLLSGRPSSIDLSSVDPLEDRLTTALAYIKERPTI